MAARLGGACPLGDGRLGPGRGRHQGHGVSRRRRRIPHTCGTGDGVRRGRRRPRAGPGRAGPRPVPAALSRHRHRHRHCHCHRHRHRHRHQECPCPGGVRHVCGAERCGEGDGGSSAPGRLPLCPAEFTQAGRQQLRVHAAAVRPARPGRRAGLGGRADHRDRQRSGHLRRVRRRTGWLPAAGLGGLPRAGRDCAGPGGEPTGPQQHRLASAAGDLRAVRDADPGRGRPL
jgi:hypothetical protein